MAQKILQKRSIIAGKVPDTGSLLVGELGINVYDGKVYIHKSGSSQSIQTLVTTDSTTTGSIYLTGTGSFGEASITFDANIGQDLYVTRDIVGNGDIDIAGAVSASIISSSLFIGNGAGLTGITASMRPDDFDFNSEPFAGTIGYIQGSGSLYKVATTNDQIDFRYNDVTIAKITQGSGPTAGFSGSLYGIGDILAFSGSVANRLAALESGSDGGEF
jgi:hypothetical protein